MLLDHSELAYLGSFFDVTGGSLIDADFYVSRWHLIISIFLMNVIDDLARMMLVI